MKSSPSFFPPSRASLERKPATRDHAERFTTAALIMAAFAVVAFIIGIVDGLSMSALIAGGSLLAVAFWLYLLAQVIHIRANTEK